MLKKSLNSVKIKLFKLEYELIMKKLREYAKRIEKKGAKAVILIGSLARGDYTAFSDADIVIIADNVPQNLSERLRDFIDPEFPIDLEPRVYTTEEILKMARNKRKIIDEIINHGILIAGNENLIRKIKKEFQFHK